MPPASFADILVYGASGFTGQLVARALSLRQAHFVLSGRESAALRSLGDELNVEVIPAALNVDALTAAFSRAGVVLSCAGPFLETGETQQRAAIQAGVHLLDISGEPEFLVRSAALDAQARERGVALIHSVGFDVVPAETLAWLISRSLPRVALLELAVCYLNGAPSRGTVKSQLGHAHDGLTFRAGALHVEPAAAHRRIVPFPPPFGPRAAVSVPLAEVVSIPRAVPCAELRTYIGTLVPAALAIAERGLLQNDVSKLSRALDQMNASGRTGPTAAEREACEFALWARAVGADGRTVEKVMTGRDPYGLTAVVAAECALRAAAPAFAARGVLTPTQAFDAQQLLATLAHLGVRWSSVS
ncbi:MAG: saccharopine dehydrogenase family protein [Myxococcaceae bacterium]